MSRDRNVEKYIADGKEIMRQGHGWKDLSFRELTQLIESGEKSGGEVELSTIALNAFYFGAAAAKKAADREPKKDPSDALKKWHREQEVRTLITMKAARISAGLSKTVRAYERGERSAPARYLYQLSMVTGFSVDSFEL